MATLIESPHAEVRFGRALHFLSQQQPARPLLVLAPTLGAGSGLLRAVTKLRGAVFGWAMESLGSLAVKLCARDLAERGLTLAPPLALEAVCVRVVSEFATQGKLGRLSRIGDRPGLPSALLRTFSELGQAAVDPDAVPGELGELYQHYRATLTSLSLTDRAGLFRAAIDNARASSSPPLGLPLCAFDLCPKTQLERAFLASLLERAPSSFATVPPNELGRELVEALFGARDDERERASGPPELSEFSSAPSALRQLQANLFSTNEATIAEGVEGDDSVSILSAPGESREAVEIARGISAEAARGVPFDRIAIVLRSPFHYRTHLLEALRRAAIPAQFTRAAARPAAAGRAFLVLLECAAEGISATRFAEYLSLGVMPNRSEAAPVSEPEGVFEAPIDDETRSLLLGPLATPEAGEPRPTQSLFLPRRWESLLVDAAVIGGPGRWHRRLDGLARSLEERLQKAPEHEQRSIQRQRDALQELRTFALPIVDALGALPSAASWGLWLDALRALAELTLDSPETVRGVLAQLEIVRDVGPVGLKDVLAVLSERLGELSVPDKADKVGGVLVSTVDEVRGRVFDVVFVPGLAEKLFPQRVVEDPLLSDEQRASISEHLETQARRVESERAALAIAVGAARRRILLSYPRFESDKARPRVPSFYALEAMRAAEGRLPGFAELARRADATSQTRIGWPAPTRPEFAIDAAEYDLAILRQLLNGAQKEVDGAAHYLLTASPRLKRALQFRARRWRPEWRYVDGLVDPNALAHDALSARHSQLNQRGFAVTALEKYAACPYRFYLATVVGLSARKEATAVEEMDASTRGLLIHELLRSVSSALHEQKLFSPSSDFAEARRVLLRTVDEQESIWRDKLAPVIARVWDDAIADISADLLRWLFDARESGWEPCAFEHPFGQIHAEAAAGSPGPVVLDSGLPLRGVIDAIEQSGNHLRATDYKTGARPEDDTVVSGGRQLQPALYAMVLEKLYPTQTVTGGNAFYCTSRGEFRRNEVPLAAPARAAAEAVHRTIESAFSNGFFPAAPAEKTCEYCEFLRICGPYERERVERKEATRLESLVQLRALR